MQDRITDIQDTTPNDERELGQPEEMRLPEEIAELCTIETREINLSEEQKQPSPRYFMQSEYELPGGYGKTRVVVQVRDPYWIHAYWEISKATYQEIAEQLGPDGWKTSTRVLRVHDITDTDLESPEPHYFFDIRVNDLANNWYINVERPNRCYCVDLGVMTKDGNFVLISRSNRVTTPRAGASEVVDEEWMTIEALERTFSGLPAGPASPGFEKRVITARSELLMGSEAVSSISSPGFAAQEKERGFWLVADTELIIYGATEPDASVTVAGQPVKLRPDGSFSLRFALPCGKHSFTIEARSKDGTMTRRITPIVERRTDQ